MKTRFILFRRAGVYYCEDTTTGKQSSLRTKNEAEAHTILSARNESFRQPGLNLQIARAYLAASDPVFAQRTWQTVMEQFQTNGKDATRIRYVRAMKSKAFDGFQFIYSTTTLTHQNATNHAPPLRCGMPKAHFIVVGHDRHRQRRIKPLLRF
jgi:hypothetical protein